MISSKTIITGEKLQDIADIYLGTYDDFRFNPYINNQPSKHYSIENISGEFYNPSIIFCYGHRIQTLFEKLHFFKNKFTLITHNSDENIIQTSIVSSILEFPLLKIWYAQNVCFSHPKLEILPIGMANRQWSHGNMSYFDRNSIITKSEHIYFQFTISTNQRARSECYNELIHKVPFLSFIDPVGYHELLSKHQFCICPEGNGVDTHRFWEALYVKTIPIVLKNDFITVVQEKLKLPMVILDSWDDLDLLTLNYEDYVFDENYYDGILIESYIKKINDSL
jgi:hypothetical protein